MCIEHQRIILKTKGEYDFLLACSQCFSIVEEDDEFCWACGCEFNKDSDASDIEELHK